MNQNIPLIAAIIEFLIIVISFLWLIPQNKSLRDAIKNLNSVVQNHLATIKSKEAHIEQLRDQINFLMNLTPKQINEFAHTVGRKANKEENVEYAPIGAWFLLYEKELKKDPDDTELKKISDELKIKKFWKHLESEKWEDFLDKSIGQEGLWAGQNITLSK